MWNIVGVVMNQKTAVSATCSVSPAIQYMQFAAATDFISDT
jgi:hypothetical protein